MIKVQATRGYQWLHKKREFMEALKKGQTFEIDNENQAEDCQQALQRGDVMIRDDRFLLPEDFYIVTREFSDRFDGRLKLFKKGDKVKLDRDIALPFLMNGCIKREHEDQWNPRYLLRMPSSGDNVKKMFDDPIPEKESWVMKGVKR